MENKYQQALEILNTISNSEHSEYLKSTLNLTDSGIQSLKERVILSDEVGITFLDGYGYHYILHHPVQVLLSKYNHKEPIFGVKIDVPDGEYVAHFMIPEGGHIFNTGITGTRNSAKETFKKLVEDIQAMLDPHLYLEENHHFFVDKSKIPLILENLPKLIEKYTPSAKQEVKDVTIKELEGRIKAIKDM